MLMGWEERGGSGKRGGRIRVKEGVKNSTGEMAEIEVVKMLQVQRFTLSDNQSVKMSTCVID